MVISLLEWHYTMPVQMFCAGADINAQTEETQETALTLTCCGGFLEVADFLIKAGADIELGCSTPLMEAAQEGHIDLVKFLLRAGKLSLDNPYFVSYYIINGCLSSLVAVVVMSNCR